MIKSTHRNHRVLKGSEINEQESSADGVEPGRIIEAGSRTRVPKGWQLFTSHGLVLIFILNQPGRTVREISLELNLTDRAVALAIADLVAEGYLVRERVGRRTFYKVNEDHPLKYPVSQYGQSQTPSLTVRSLRAENLATHITHLSGGFNQEQTH